MYAGRLSPEKGIELLLEILKRMPQYKLILAGDGPQKKELTSLFRNHEIIFLNHCSQEDLRVLYSNLDVFVLPSVTETLGFVLLEAMACGCCVIGMNAGGVKNIIQNEVNGFIVERNDIEKIVFYINKIENEKKYSLNFH